MIHQVKSWIRTTYSWVSDFNLNRNFNEFCFRINKPQSKATIFSNLITKMIENDKVAYHKIICNQLLTSINLITHLVSLAHLTNYTCFHNQKINYLFNEKFVNYF